MPPETQARTERGRRTARRAGGEVEVGPPAPQQRRAYNSGLRRQQAERTRETITAAAGPLFGEFGYARTSVRQIAGAAGVSVETVYTLGDKREVFLAAFEMAVRGDIRGTPLLDLDAMRDAHRAVDLHGLLGEVARFVFDGNRRSVRLWAAFIEAANSDDQIAEAYGTAMTRMRQRAEPVLAFAVERGFCERPRRPRETLDAVWAVLHPGQYDLLVVQAGWSGARYRRWLVSAMTFILTSGALD